MKHRLPFFVIDFSGPKYDHLTYDFVDQKFVSGDIFVGGVDSLHFGSVEDDSYFFIKNWLNFERPIFVHHS